MIHYFNPVLIDDLAQRTLKTAEEISQKSTNLLFLLLIITVFTDTFIRHMKQ